MKRNHTGMRYARSAALGGWPFGALLGVILTGLAAMTVALSSIGSSVAPQVIGLDPWHEHVLIGGSSRADQARALAAHRHPFGEWHLHSSGIQEVQNGSMQNRAVVVSITDHVVADLNSISASAQKALLSLDAVLLNLPASMAVLIGLTSLLLRTPTLLPPPTPPPRP